MLQPIVSAFGFNMSSGACDAKFDAKALIEHRVTKVVPLSCQSGKILGSSPDGEELFRIDVPGDKHSIERTTLQNEIAKNAKIAAGSVEILTNSGYHGASFSLTDINCITVRIVDAKFTLRALKDAGFGAQQLADAGFDLRQLKEAGFDARRLRDSGYSAKQLREVGFRLGQLRNAGFNLGQAAGFPLFLLLLLFIGACVAALRSPFSGVSYVLVRAFAVVVFVSMLVEAGS